METISVMIDKSEKLLCKLWKTMVDTFKRPYNNSSESFTFILKKRFSKQPPRQVLEKYTDASLVAAQNPTLFLEVLVMCSTFILWTTAVVMLIFSGYVMYQQYGISLLADATDFLISMVLQMVASLTIAAAASLICACHNPAQLHVPRLSKWGLIFVVTSALILSAEIGTTLYHRTEPSTYLEDKMKKQLLHDMQQHQHNKEWDDMHKTLSCCGVYSKEDWPKFGKPIPLSCCKHFQENECILWLDKGCLTEYTLVKNKFASFLIGSAAVSLANCLIVIAILVRLLLVSLEMTRDRRRLRAIQTYTHRFNHPSNSVSIFNRPYITPEQSRTALVQLLNYKEKEIMEKTGELALNISDSTKSVNGVDEPLNKTSQLKQKLYKEISVVTREMSSPNET